MTTDSLLTYVFCTSCQPEIVLPVLQIKSKTSSCFNLYKLRKSRKDQSSNFDLIEQPMDLSCINLAVLYSNDKLIQLLYGGKDLKFWTFWEHTQNLKKIFLVVLTFTKCAWHKVRTLNNKKSWVYLGCSAPLSNNSKCPYFISNMQLFSHYLGQFEFKLSTKYLFTLAGNSIIKQTLVCTQNLRSVKHRQIVPNINLLSTRWRSSKRRGKLDLWVHF